MHKFVYKKELFKKSINYPINFTIVSNFSSTLKIRLKKNNMKFKDIKSKM